MKRTRRLAAALLAALMMTTSAFAAVQSAKDVPASSWAYKPVSYVLEKDIMDTDGQGNFRIQEEMTRAEFVYSLWRAAGRPAPAASSPFRDVSASSRYYKAVSWAAAEQVASGTSATTFSPGSTLTREQAFTFLWKALPALGLRQDTGGALTVFRDGDTVSSWARTAVEALYVRGIVTGTNENKLEPRRTVKRGEAASGPSPSSPFGRLSGSGGFFLGGRPLFLSGALYFCMRSSKEAPPIHSITASAARLRVCTIRG